MNTINLLKRIMAFFIGVFILLTPTTAFSLDDSYIHNEFNEEYYWSSVKANAVGDGNEFSGIIKHIEDVENGCFYLYFSFTDYKLNPNIKDNISIGFTVENANNKYYFSVDKNGFTKNSDDSIEDNIEIKYSFDKSSCARYGGEIYLGFELKNRTDQMLTNYISCQYYCGEYSRHSLFNSIKLDMNVLQTSSDTSEEEKTTKQESVKETTNTHSSKTDINESNSSKTNNNNVSSEKTDSSYIGNSTNSQNDNSNETSTKFSGTRTITTPDNKNETSTANSEKFSGNNNSYEIESSENYDDNATEKFDSSSLNGESNENGLSDTFGNQNILNYSNQRTKSVKIMIIASIAIILVGVMCVLIGAFVHNKSEKAAEEGNDNLTSK